MSTFSEIVDEVAKSTGMQPNLPLVVGFVNRAIKALTPMYHYSDLVEWRTELNHRTSGGSHSLMLPTNHRTTRTVRLDQYRFAVRKLPGLSQAVTVDAASYYYEAGLRLHIKGKANRFIDVAYYRVTPKMRYFAPEYRLLRSNQVEDDSHYEFRPQQTNEWTALDLNNPLHVTSYDRHTSWITRGYGDVLTTGALSHAFNHKGEAERGSRLFQIFRSDVAELKKAHRDINIGQQ